jgi:FMN phosphatase YigB (HAD superfamily)
MAPHLRVASRRWRIALVLVAAMLLLAGCQVDTEAVVVLREDGSGTVTVTVTLDPEAAAQVPDLGEQLAVDDLTRAGWEIAGPQTVDGGGVQVEATKPFATPDEGAAVLAELTGPDGVLTEIELTIENSFGRTTSSFSAEADPSGGIVGLADDALIQVLGDDLGGQLARIEAETGATADEQATLTLTVQLPGARESWALAPGTEATTLDLEHQQLRPVPIALAAGAVVLLVVGLILLVVRIIAMARDHRYRRRYGGLPGDDIDAQVEGSIAGGSAATEVAAVSADEVAWADAPAATTADTPAPPTRRLQLVVLDVTGVVLDRGEDAPALLVEFARQRGSRRSDDQITASYLLATEGRLPVGELWASIGLAGDPGHLADDFLASFRLRPGAREFLERMLARDLPVAGVANDVAEWSRKLRATHKLEHLTKAWIVSGDVGERLPGGAVLGRVIQATGIEARNALLISDRLDYLDTARSFGFAGVWFVPDDVADDQVPDDAPYPIVRSFSDLGLG